MEFVRIIIAVLFVITLGVAIHEYIKMRRLLKEHGDKKLEDVLPEMQALFKRIAIIMCIFAGYLMVYLLLGIIFDIIK